MPPLPQIPPERRVIRLSPDFSRRYPLWEDGTPTWDVGYTTTPDHYGLSRELAEDLEGWQSFWETHIAVFDREPSAEHLARWLRDGRWLAERLRAEVAHFADVRAEFG